VLRVLFLLLKTDFRVSTPLFYVGYAFVIHVNN